MSEEPSDFLIDPSMCPCDECLTGPEKPPGPSEREWTVHVLGPDDIMPATDYAAAVRQANEINKTVEDGLPTRTEYHPFVWAIPVRQGYYAYPLKPGETC